MWCYYHPFKRILRQRTAVCSAPHSLRTGFLLVTLPLFLIGPHHRICVSSCPPGHYHADKKRCRKCAPNCETCFGSHGDQCLSCKYGYFLNEETNSCVTHCPDGSYQDPSELIPKCGFHFNDQGRRGDGSPPWNLGLAHLTGSSQFLREHFRIALFKKKKKVKNNFYKNAYNWQLQRILRLVHRFGDFLGGPTRLSIWSYSWAHWCGFL